LVSPSLRVDSVVYSWAFTRMAPGAAQMHVGSPDHAAIAGVAARAILLIPKNAMSEAAIPPTPPSQWDIEFERLRARFPDAKPSVFCVHAMQQRPDIDMAGLKALAELHGLKVSIGSWNGARNLLAPPRLKASPEPASPTSLSSQSPEAAALLAPADQPAG